MRSSRRGYAPPVQTAVFWIMAVLFVLQMVWWIYYQLQHARDDLLAINENLEIDRYRAITAMTARFAPEHERLRYAISNLESDKITETDLPIITDAMTVSVRDSSGHEITNWSISDFEGRPLGSWVFASKDGSVRVWFAGESIANLIRRDYPQLQVEFAGDGHYQGESPVSRLRLDDLSVSRSAISRSESEYKRHVYMFAGEGAFFMLLIFAGSYVIHRALHQSYDLRNRQHNFLAAATHELKSPLASIRLFAETLGRPNLTEKQRDELRNSIVRSADQMTASVENVLEAGRRENGEYKLNLIGTDLSRDLKDYLNNYHGQARALGLEWHESIEDGIHCCTDHHAFRRAVGAVLDNALKYSEGQQGAIDVELRRNNGNATLTVRDSGRGIERSDLSRVFDRFYRGGNEDTREVRGTGLGLYLARQIVEAHGGEIGIHSDGIGCGTTVRIDLPMG